MTWDEFKKHRQAQMAQYDMSRYKLTEITCPNCGEYIYRDTMLVLTSYPPQNSYKCPKCKWQQTGY